MPLTGNCARKNFRHGLIVITLLLGGCFATPQESLQSILDDHWENSNVEQVFFRTDPDAWRMNGKLAEVDSQARARRKAFNEEILARLENVDASVLNPQDQVSYRLFLYERLTERDSYDQYEHFFPFSALSGYHTYFADAPSAMTFLAAPDYERYLVSLADFPRYNDEHLALLREAIARGFTHYCESLAGYEDTISDHIVDNVEDSGLYVPFLKFPPKIPAEQQAEFAARGAELIRSHVIPGYQALLDLYLAEYLPACRNAVGVTSLDGGTEYYDYLIRYFTTTDLPPDEIHKLGLAEVRRIRTEMEEIIRQIGFDGDFAEFLEYLRSAPEFYARTEAELLGRAALISKSAEGELPKFFATLPSGTYSIKANPSRGSFYMPSSGDGTTSGTYFVGMEKLDSQPLYTLESLTLHEAVPGHHLQSALAMELGLPDFRRQLYHSGFGEGWGLYSEFLGVEMGFYQDPYSNFGRLIYEAWRACRLVVDTGMHAFGWSRQEAIDFMLENTALSEHEIVREIDRYITWPAQALAYKIGELKIKGLRIKAEKALGDEFDIRAFHDTVLGNGSLPIQLLEQIVNEWIDDQL